jgi:hypothetical protein
MTIPYRFAPWSRRGLARAHRNPDTAGGPLAARPRITVGLTLQAKRDGNAVTAVSGNVDLTLYGPADVIGIDQRLVVRTDPKPNVTNFEPNYLAIVDFDPPDFPWLLTPAHADGTEHLRPWLVLVVIERAKAGLPVLVAGRPLPSIALNGADTATELPDLNESWLWAHTQAVSQVAAADRAALSAELNAHPERNISRLVCPRRLQPRTDYVACVVPATDGGRLRGLGQPVVGDTLQPAWSKANPTDIELPVYFHWEFSTGPVGDIETLARRLRTPAQYAGDAALIQQLRHIGEQPVAVDGDHLLFDGVTPGTTTFEGAMVSLDFTPADPDAGFAGKLQAMLNSGHDSAISGAPPGDQVPTLSPPIYGEYPARRHTVDVAKVTHHWLDGSSCQPRYRLAAGWGAEVVRQNQDEFMQAAWEQVGEVLAAERALSLARLSRDVLKRVEARHLAKLAPERLLALLAPSRSRIRVSPTQSLHGQMATATLPPELFDGAMRRLTSPRRPTFRLAQWRERNLAPASTSVQMAALVQTFAKASQHLDAIDPNRFVPDGLMGSRSYDAIPLPADLAAVVDLMPYTGLNLTMTGAEIKTIQQQNASARELSLKTKKAPPAMDDVWHRGLLTETHAIRVAQLERAAAQPLEGDIGHLIQQSSKRATEGVLLSVQGGKLASQALRIDARSGALKAYGSALTLGRSGPPVRRARFGPSTVAAVPLHALKLYGNTAVFTSLPPSTLGQGDAKVSIGLAGPGRFAIGAAGAVGAVPTITIPPAAKDHATLGRYSAAFKDYQHVVSPPASSLPVLEVVDFPTATAAAQVRVRTNPQESVPARLASMLSLGAQSVGWSNGLLSNSFISTRLDLTLAETLRFLIPRTFDRVMHFPHLLFPLSRKLEKFAPEVFLPGVGVLPNDFIMAVKTNPRFVEALMLGANHEMGREMLWQGYPTDSRGTPFQKFWQRLDGKDDIAPIHQWKSVPLGAQPASTEMLVLLIRGQLLERFPNLSIYAYPLTGTEKRPGGSSPPVQNDVQEMDPNKIVLPVMHGHLNKDITYVGFPIVPGNIAAFFFVIEEHMTEPRFGFDEPDNDNQHGNTWLQIDWSEVGVAGGAYFGSAALKSATPATGPRWTNPHAATVADALLQRPFRGYWKGQALKMPPGA